MSLLEIDNVTLRFGGLVAVDSVSLAVNEGEMSHSLSAFQNGNRGTACNRLTQKDANFSAQNDKTSKRWVALSE